LRRSRDRIGHGSHKDFSSNRTSLTESLAPIGLWVRYLGPSSAALSAVTTLLALSQRLSPLGLIFRSPTSTSGKIILVNFRISLLKYI